MKSLKNVLSLVAASSLLFASCTKDVIVSEENEMISASVSDNVTVNDAVETAPLVHTSVVYNVNSNVAGFWQSVPSRYSQTTKKYPLILFIHGIGELGTSLSRMNCCGLPKHIYNKSFPANFNVKGVNYSFIVISPQFKVRPSADQIQSVIEFAKRRWRIDESMIYVTGLSMGGGSTWDWAAIHGQHAAAIVPVCAGTKPSTSMADKLATKNLPIWGLYSSADAVVPVQWGKDFFNWIDARNSTYASRTKLTVWTDASHNATWQRAFNPLTVVDGYNIYQWMLLNKKGTTSVISPTPTPAPTPAPAPSTGTNLAPVAKAGLDRTILLSSGINRVTLDGLTSTDADGTISTYSWTKVSGPANNFYTIKPGKVYAAQLVKGIYVFRLTVTDNKGAIGTDDVKVTVN